VLFISSSSLVNILQEELFIPSTPAKVTIRSKQPQVTDAALRDGTSEDGLYIDTLSQMLAVHLARNHSSQSRPGRMPPVQAMAGWRMRRVIEYIEENLDGDLSLEAMAAEVDISPIYPARSM
jgi:hypothetical protein